MKSTTVVAVVIIIIVVLAGGWFWLMHGQSAMAPGMDMNGQPMVPANATTTGTTSTSTTSGAFTVGNNLALGEDSNATLGKYVIGFNGMTLYTYAKDSPGTTTCYGECAQNWPPYTVTSTSNLMAEAPLASSSVSVITRADGTAQLTYNGMPLYFYVGDSSPEQTNGQGIGGVWAVAKP